MSEESRRERELIEVWLVAVICYILLITGWIKVCKHFTNIHLAGTICVHNYLVDYKCKGTCKLLYHLYKHHFIPIHS